MRSAWAYLTEHAREVERAEDGRSDGSLRPAIEGRWLADFECVEAEGADQGVPLSEKVEGLMLLIGAG
jgi:hypothetical protein